MNVDVAKNLKEVLGNLPDEVSLVAISKYHPLEYLEAAYAAGQRIFGESHEQELRVKVPAMPQDVSWHFIGHLQTNKVKHIAPYISMIEAVDSFKLLKEVDKQAAKCGRVIKVLLELHVAEEESKYGFTFEACREMLRAGEWRDLRNVRICGLMMMATNTDDESVVAGEMTRAADFFDELKHDYFADADDFCYRSWGMSQDYRIAVRCRSNMVRVGTSIFGPRVY